tara:strand:+ start:141 stop:647 length:507 start_codon:yes stop_codon:yes gene_type:complete
MPGLNNMPTWDNVLEALTVADMGPDQKQAMLDQIMEDVGQGMQPSMKYFGARPSDMDMRQMEIPADRYASTSTPDMYRRNFQSEDSPLRQGEMMTQNNPMMTRRQVESDMEMDRVAEEMRMRQQQGMGARPSDMDMRQLQRMGARPSDMDMSSELDAVAREMMARRRR